MKQTRLVLLLVCTMLLPLAVALAQNETPNGPHYNLNIIGVENPKKNTKMDNSNRHTIFVDLGRSGTVTTDIWLKQGEFQVCDGNGFDEAYDCNGVQIKNYYGATFQLPCNQNVPADEVCAGTQEYYEVWVRALGKPGGQAWITLCAYDTVDEAWECNSNNVFVVRNIGGGTPHWSEVTNDLTMFTDPSGDNAGHKVPLFYSDYEDWYWEYDNHGLKLAQIRFYEVPTE